MLGFGPWAERSKKTELQREEQFRHLLWVARRRNQSGILQLLQGGPAAILSGAVLEQMRLPRLLTVSCSSLCSSFILRPPHSLFFFAVFCSVQKYTNLRLSASEDDPVLAFCRNSSQKSAEAFQRRIRDQVEIQGIVPDSPETVRKVLLLTRFHFVSIAGTGHMEARWPIGLIRRIRRITAQGKRDAPGKQELAAIFQTSSAADGKLVEKEDRIR